MCVLSNPQCSFLFPLFSLFLDEAGMSDFQKTRTGKVRVRVEVEVGKGAGGVTEVPYTWEQSLDEVDVRIPQPSRAPLTRRSVPRVLVDV